MWMGGVIIAFIVLFAQTSKADKRITMLEINNQRLLSRIDSMMDKIESKNLANLAKDSQKSVESSAESKKAEFRVHINESPTKPRESTFQSFETPRHKAESIKAESAESTQSTQSKTTTDSPQHINATNGANSTNATFSFEQFLAQKAMIILGGIFFVLAAYFCIKYAIEHNFLTPQVRIAGAMCFGALLFMIGFALDRFDRFALRSAISARIAQTLIGVASVVEFFAIYGGYALYCFFGEVLSFALLCAVSFGAIFLTLRFGLIVGIFGLVGGFATPFLIDAQSPQFLLPMRIFTRIAPLRDGYLAQKRSHSIALKCLCALLYVAFS